MRRDPDVLSLALLPLLGWVLLAMAPAQVCGDVDGSGGVGILDALVVAQMAAGVLTPTAEQLSAGDVDATGFLSILDALQIARAAAGMSPVTCTRPPGAWQDLTAASLMRPSPRVGHAVAVDPARHRAVVFGGFAGTMLGLRHDAFSFDLASSEWTILFPAGPTPGARARHGLVADPSRDRMLMVFGHLGVGSGDAQVHALDFSTPTGSALGGRGEWIPLSTPGDPALGTAPAPRYDMAVSFDTLVDGLVVHAGTDHSGLYNHDDLWLLDLTGSPHGQWVRLTQVGDVPGPRDQHTLTWIPDRGVHLLFGGYDAVGGPTHGTFELTVRMPQAEGSWRRLQNSGMVPMARQQHVAVYDLARQRLILSTGTLENVWLEILDLSVGGDGAWYMHTIPTGVAPAFRQHAVGWTDDQGCLLIHGGVEGYTGELLQDTWRICLP